MADPFQDVQAALQRAMAERTGQDDQAAAMRQVGIMIGMAVRSLTEKAQATAAEQAAMRDMLQQLSASAADIVGLMEADRQQGDGQTPAEKRAEDQAEAQIKAQAMADVFAPLLAALKLPAPRVQVDVQPAAVSVPQPKVEVTVQPPVVDRAGQQWRIELERASKNPAAPISALIVTRL